MNLLITGAWTDAQENISALEEVGHEVVFMQNESEKLPCEHEWVEGVVCNGLFLSHEIGKFTNLKYIQLTSAGLDRVPMEYINENNIEIHNAKGVYSIPMAEFAICGVLQLYKQSKFFAKSQNDHLWIKNRNLFELHNKTVCIVGCGNVGTECAKRFKAFGCRVLGVDIDCKNCDDYERITALDELDSILTESDVVVLTLPLTEQTHHLFDEARFCSMKNGAVLVNIARGALVNTKALEVALKEKLMGAVLDVFEEEPLNAESVLWDIDNVLVTPHNCFVGDGNRDRLTQVILENLEGNDR